MASPLPRKHVFLGVLGWPVPLQTRGPVGSEPVFKATERARCERAARPMDVVDQRGEDSHEQHAMGVVDVTLTSLAYCILVINWFSFFF